ncbi:hypothetical protein KCP75_24970 [Salmonella enterica subsp. enterica]|nr:hypothetical protein KCP75_24970 [Salmonella enterica subsp. enterica]
MRGSQRAGRLARQQVIVNDLVFVHQDHERTSLRPLHLMALCRQRSWRGKLNVSQLRGDFNCVQIILADFAVSAARRCCVVLLIAISCSSGTHL